jgi:hypothetical protein
MEIVQVDVNHDDRHIFIKIDQDIDAAEPVYEVVLAVMKELGYKMADPDTTTGVPLADEWTLTVEHMKDEDEEAP